MEPKKLLYKFNIDSYRLRIKHNKNDKILINKYKKFALNKTTALLQDL